LQDHNNMNSEKRQQLIKKLLYQSANRGCKETDILVGNFAKINLEKMTNQELEIFSDILQLQDADIYDWYTQKKPLPKEHDSLIMQQLLNFTLPLRHPGPKDPGSRKRSNNEVISASVKDPVLMDSRLRGNDAMSLDSCLELEVPPKPVS
jgi:antitoxin CptB